MDGRGFLTLLLGLGLAGAACTTTSDMPEVTTDLREAILRVEQVGGFVPLEFALASGPQYVLTGDRRLISEGPQIAIYPGPMLPGYQAAQLGENDLRRVLEAVVATGLPTFEAKLDDSAARFVADAATTVVTFWDSNGEHRFGVYGLGIGEFDDPQIDALRDLLVLLDELTATQPGQIYQTDRIQVIAAEVDPTGDPADVVKPWPIEAGLDSLSELIEPYGCLVFSGDEGELLIEAFDASREETLWVDGGVSYRVLARQVLPGEDGCRTPS
jgi:hypothetical protein